MVEIKNFKCNVYSICEQAMPTFSWVITSKENSVEQKQYRLIIKDVTDGEERVEYDSLDVASSKSVWVEIDKELLPGRTYKANVYINTTLGEARAETTFKTGLLGTDFSAKWIYSGKRNKADCSDPVHIFKKRFDLPYKICDARLYASAMGIYSIKINGRKILNEYFAPGDSNGRKHVYYRSYNLDDFFKEEKNPEHIEFQASVANGWYLGRVNETTNSYGDRRGIIIELHLTDEDGKVHILSTDETWEWTDMGPVRFADFYDGETYDANAIPDKFKPCKLVPDRFIKKVIPHEGVPVLAHEVIKPVIKFRNESGDIVYDFGQNFAGIVRFCANEKKGTEIVIKHGEILVGKNVFTDNLRSAKATIKYICSGENDTYSPEFTYMGFRYISVSGCNDEAGFSVEGIVLYSDMQQVGTFECSNAYLNKLQKNIQWSEKANFIDIPTDCPQRDERLGWTGDIAVFAPTAAYNMDITYFMRKWLYDLASEQVRGIVPFVIPHTKMIFDKPTPTCGWGDAATMVPWAVYRSSGDTSIIKRQYESMKGWVNAVLRCMNEKLIWEEGFQFGDWLAPDGGFKVWTSRSKWIASCYAANSLDIVSKSAEILGKKEDARKYARLRDSVKKAFNDEFVCDDGTIKGGFQSAYVCALWFDMLPEDKREGAYKALIEDIKAHNGLLNTGFLGTPYLLFALSDFGDASEAYKMLLNEECPSWIYPIKCGATSMWERWDGLKPDGTIFISEKDNMVSFNHYAYGAVGDWLYKRCAGIDMIEPGYKKFIVAPKIGGNLDYVKATHMTPYGEISVKWEIKGGKFVLEVLVPANTSAVVVMPGGRNAFVKSGEHRFAESIDVLENI